MRDIQLPVRYKAALPPTEEDWSDAKHLRKLGGRISSAALAIDDVIVSILMHTVLGEVREHRQLVIGSILKTNWCSLEAKRTLLLAMVERFQLLPKTEKNTLEKSMRHIIEYRNAFAHGTLLHTGEAHALQYFKGGPQSLVLNDALLEKLEGHFLSAWNTLVNIESKLEAGG